MTKTHDVFGVSNTILRESYVDRGMLDERIQMLLSRRAHVALRGESKCGKSWLRQKNIPDALVVQCRLNKTARDIYIDALSQLGIRIVLERNESETIRGTAEGSGEFGVKLLSKISVKLGLESTKQESSKTQPAGHNFDDLRFIAEILKESNRKLVIEDFHYMSTEQRKAFAFDLKALWDYGLFVTIIGVWSHSNYLIYLNPDLSGRIEEISIYWSDTDLQRIIDQGSIALNIRVNPAIAQKIISSSFGNSGILQMLILRTLDEAKFIEANKVLYELDNDRYFESAAMLCADQLNPLYQEFARRLSVGIRKRNNSTAIYAHAMAVIFSARDEDFIRGITLDYIFEQAHARQSRIQKQNLKRVLQKFDDLQIDDQGRGLVMTYNDSSEAVTVIDRQILLYRKYATVNWPWEDIIKEYDQKDDQFG